MRVDSPTGRKPGASLPRPRPLPLPPPLSSEPLTFCPSIVRHPPEQSGIALIDRLEWTLEIYIAYKELWGKSFTVPSTDNLNFRRELIAMYKRSTDFEVFKRLLAPSYTPSQCTASGKETLIIAGSLRPNNQHVVLTDTINPPIEDSVYKPIPVIPTRNSFVGYGLYSPRKLASLENAMPFLSVGALWRV